MFKLQQPLTQGSLARMSHPCSSTNCHSHAGPNRHPPPRALAEESARREMAREQERKDTYENMKSKSANNQQQFMKNNAAAEARQAEMERRIQASLTLT